MTNPPTGWHPDPEDASSERWWDAGTGQWLDHTRARSGPPVVSGPPESAPYALSATAGAMPGPPPQPAPGNWRRQLLIVGAVILALFVLLGIIGALTEDKKDDKADPSGASASSTTSSVANSTPRAAAAPPSATITTTSPTTTTPTTTTTTTTATTKAAPPPPPYPGAIKNDAVTDQRGRVEVRGLTAFIGPLRRVPAVDFDGPRLCSNLALQNESSESQYYDASDFTIQYPSGNEKGAVLVYDGDVGTGNLVPGGRTTGQVCFVDRAEVGQHLVLWNRTDLSSFSTPRRGVWPLNVPR